MPCTGHEATYTRIHLHNVCRPTAVLLWFKTGRVMHNQPFYFHHVLNEQKFIRWPLRNIRTGAETDETPKYRNASTPICFFFYSRYTAVQIGDCPRSPSNQDGACCADCRQSSCSSPPNTDQPSEARCRKIPTVHPCGDDRWSSSSSGPGDGSLRRIARHAVFCHRVGGRWTSCLRLARPFRPHSAALGGRAGAPQCRHCAS